MRLIDADALKEKLDELEPYIDCDENSTTWILSDEVYNAIDNASTVPLPDFKEGYKQAIIDGKTNYARLQGKWIFHKDFNESCRYGCNQCGNLNNIPSNFCPNCGIRMIKEKCEDCPLNHYGMTCTSHRIEYWEEHGGKKE